MLQAYTWLHALLYCDESHIHKLTTNQYNKVVQEIRKFLISSSKSKCFILMNAKNFNGKLQENAIPPSVGSSPVHVQTPHKDAYAMHDSNQTMCL